MERLLILASSSPRRQELLAQIGVAFTVMAADIDESRQGGESIGRYVLRLSQEKARAISLTLNSATAVLGADTAVALGEELLAKPTDQMDAWSMLNRLSDMTHTVYTGVSVAVGEQLNSVVVSTQVTFKKLSDEDLKVYLASNEWSGKAGGYAIQGRAGRFVKHLVGSYSNVVGLPLYETAELLATAGIRIG
jgi:septum formation protein